MENEPPSPSIFLHFWALLSKVYDVQFFRRKLQLRRWERHWSIIHCRFLLFSTVNACFNLFLRASYVTFPLNIYRCTWNILTTLIKIEQLTLYNHRTDATNPKILYLHIVLTYAGQYVPFFIRPSTSRRIKNYFKPFFKNARTSLTSNSPTFHCESYLL